jgi:hypothetical protein
VLTAKGLAPGPVPTEVAPVTFENGETLWLDATWRRRVTLLSAFLQKEPKPARTIMGFSTGGGIAHYFGCRLLTRQSWFMAGFVRPYDEEEIRASLPKTKALIVLLDKPMEFPFSSNANRWGFGPMFSDALATEIPNRFATSVKLDACCWVLPATRNVSTR